MSRAARSMAVFSVYLATASAVLVVRPTILTVPLQLPVGDGLWVRVAGMLTGYLAFYYWRAARTETTTFIRWTVIGRLTVMLFFLGFVLAGVVGAQFLLVGTVDVAAALWTWRCLKVDERATGSSRVEASSPRDIRIQHSRV